MRIETGINWGWVRAALDSESWEHDPENRGSQVRRCYLGCLINPSGKYYTPWACSNLEECPVCGGKGTVRVRASKRRRAKAAARIATADTQVNRLRASVLTRSRPGRKVEFWGPGAEDHRAAVHARNALIARLQPIAEGQRECARCGGCGSAEAYDDQVFWELLEAEASDRGLSVEPGEGDPCDTFVLESRDTPTHDDDDEDSDDAIDPSDWDIHHDED